MGEGPVHLGGRAGLLTTFCESTHNPGKLYYPLMLSVRSELGSLIFFHHHAAAGGPLLASCFFFDKIYGLSGQDLQDEQDVVGCADSADCFFVIA